ncbi:MAG: hypothetical protein HYV27_10740 [Candidatus Hydrogenedentes bacterium]|nr:hypothetical protein [Candidatus Hydrogenedentota bacterium]
MVQFLAEFGQEGEEDRLLNARLLSEERVAALLDLELPEVRRLFEAGELPGKQLGTRWFITERMLIQTIEPERFPQPARPLFPASPKTVMKLDPKSNTWVCTHCNLSNSPEYVECPNCGEARRAPLICYIPQRNSA